MPSNSTRKSLKTKRTNTRKVSHYFEVAAPHCPTKRCSPVTSQGISNRHSGD